MKNNDVNSDSIEVIFPENWGFSCNSGDGGTTEPKYFSYGCGSGGWGSVHGFSSKDHESVTMPLHQIYAASGRTRDEEEEYFRKLLCMKKENQLEFLVSNNQVSKIDNLKTLGVYISVLSLIRVECKKPSFIVKKISEKFNLTQEEVMEELNKLVQLDIIELK